LLNQVAEATLDREVRNVKRGLLLATALVATALAAPVAGAANIESDEYSAELSGQQTTTMVFTVDGATSSCKSASLSGTLSEPAEAVSLHPAYSECSAFGFASATVTTTGCSFVLHAGSEIEKDRFAGTADISCESGQKITIVASTCEIQIGSQTGLAEVEVVNDVASSPVAISLVHNITGLKVNKTKDGFLCPLKGTGEGTGNYTGTQLVKAAAGGNQIGAAAAQPPIIEFGPPPPLIVPIEPNTKKATIKNKTRVIQKFAVNGTSALPFKKTGTTCGAKLEPLGQCEDTLTTEVGWPAEQMGFLIVEIFPLREFQYPIKSP
jgi:hypothetical protein